VASKSMSIKLLKIKSNTLEPKYEQVIRSIVEAVNKKKLRRGDKLPSINKVSKNFDISMNTVVKAYDRLKKRGIIESTGGKCFQIASESITHTIRVFLLFDEFNLFKQDLYNSFKETFGDKAKIDIFFHHYNFTVYENLILENLGKYGMYVIMPHPDKAAENVLRKIDPDQILILDQKHHISDTYSSIIQDFEKETYECLKISVEHIKKYKAFCIVYPNLKIHREYDPFAQKIAAGARTFCQDNGIEYRIERNFNFAQIEKNCVYLVILDDELVELVKAAKAKKFEIGRDIGIISFNDNQLKEVICGGITTISTDFKYMGRIAAQSILDYKSIKEVNPASLILRKSL
jgi:DNA-binding transcriptional regulator YhcF (GntR family)